MTAQERLEKLRYRIEGMYRIRREAESKYAAVGADLFEARVNEQKARDAYLAELEMVASEVRRVSRRGR